MESGNLSGPLEIIFLIIAFLIFFSILWNGIIFLVSRVSGWGQLAQTYAANGRTFAGKEFHFRSASFRYLNNYSGVITIGISQDEFYLSVFPLYRFGHPPLIFPLREVSGEENRLFIANQVLLHFEQVPNIKIRIRQRLADQLEEASHQSWTYKRIDQA